MQNLSAKSGGQAPTSAGAESSRAWWCQQATADSQTKLGATIELGWVLDITMEQSMPSKHQHTPAQLHVAATNNPGRGPPTLVR